MAKIAGISGSLAGKVGNIVYSVLKGVNIARQYNPQPYNPSTSGQVEARAKLKLISQLSAITANQLAMVRKATETARNVFVKINYAYLTYADGAAQMSLADMQLTSGNLGLPGFRVERVPNYGMSVTLINPAYPAFDKVVWVVYKVLEDGKLMFNESKVIDLTDALPLGATIMQNVAADCTIHCYGINTKSAKAVAAFENLVVVTADEVARLVSTRAIGESDVSFSETRGLYFAADEDNAVTSGKALTLTLETGTTGVVLTGGGAKAFGEQYTIEASVREGVHFVEWQDVNGNVVSTANPYTGVMGSTNLTLRAIYAPTQP